MVSFFPPGLTGSRLRIALRRRRSGIGTLLRLSWTVVLEHTVAAGGPSFLDFGLSVAYPAGDVVTLLILLYAVSRAPAFDGACWPWSASGLVSLTVSDSAFTYLSSPELQH